MKQRFTFWQNPEVKVLLATRQFATPTLYHSILSFDAQDSDHV
jgi:hypothetical protein